MDREWGGGGVKKHEILCVSLSWPYFFTGPELENALLILHVFTSDVLKMELLALLQNEEAQG